MIPYRPQLNLEYCPYNNLKGAKPPLKTPIFVITISKIGVLRGEAPSEIKINSIYIYSVN
jgi:hypothetical protein